MHIFNFFPRVFNNWIMQRYNAHQILPKNDKTNNSSNKSSKVMSKSHNAG